MKKSEIEKLDTKLHSFYFSYNPDDDLIHLARKHQGGISVACFQASTKGIYNAKYWAKKNKHRKTESFHGAKTRYEFI